MQKFSHAQNANDRGTGRVGRKPTTFIAALNAQQTRRTRTLSKNRLKVELKQVKRDERDEMLANAANKLVGGYYHLYRHRVAVGGATVLIFLGGCLFGAGWLVGNANAVNNIKTAISTSVVADGQR